jgi:hypothetical protein
MASNIPSKPPDIDKLDGVEPIGQKSTQLTPDASKFSTFMNQEVQNQPTQSSSNAPSPMSIANQNTIAQKPPSIAEVQNQMQSVSSSLGDIKNQLHTKGLKLKQSDKYLIRSKLGNMNQSLRSVSQNLGLNPGPSPDLSSKSSPIAKFLELVSDGQKQLGSAAQDINNASKQPGGVNPAKLILVQVKLQKAQQELDFTSAILGKSTDMIKTLFNVQI